LLGQGGAGVDVLDTPGILEGIFGLAAAAGRASALAVEDCFHCSTPLWASTAPF